MYMCLSVYISFLFCVCIWGVFFCSLTLSCWWEKKQVLLADLWLLLYPTVRTAALQMNKTYLKTKKRRFASWWCAATVKWQTERKGLTNVLVIRQPEEKPSSWLLLRQGRGEKKEASWHLEERGADWLNKEGNKDGGLLCSESVSLHHRLVWTTKGVAAVPFFSLQIL